MHATLKRSLARTLSLRTKALKDKRADRPSLNRTQRVNGAGPRGLCCAVLRGKLRRAEPGASLETDQALVAVSLPSISLCVFCQFVVPRAPLRNRAAANCTEEADLLPPGRLVDAHSGRDGPVRSSSGSCAANIQQHSVLSPRPGSNFGSNGTMSSRVGRLLPS
jgi:hypothetical protein